MTAPVIYRDSYFGDAQAYLPAQMNSFFYCRHGATEANLRGLVQGHVDNLLSDRGEIQAIALRPIVRALGIGDVISSPLKRAYRTAELAIQDTALTVQNEDDLKERSFGRFEGQTPPTIDMFLGNYPGCEDTQHFSRRVARGLRHCVKEKTLIFGHGCVLRTIIGLLTANIDRAEDLGNAQLLYFGKRKHGWEIINLTSISIASITAIEIIDTGGRPAVEVTVTTSVGAEGVEATPTGTTVGQHEPHVLRDGDTSRYKGLGVQTAVKNVEEILGPALVGMNVFDQNAIDRKMRDLDGTSKLSHIGGNAIGSVSAAVLRAAAASLKMPVYRYLARAAAPSLPIPVFNVINGNRKQERKDLCYEYMIVPYGATDIHEAVQMGVEVFATLKTVWQQEYQEDPPIGASLGYQATSADPDMVLAFLSRVIDRCGYTGQIAFAIDCAACDIYDRATHTYPWDGRRVKAADLIAPLKRLTEKFPIVFLEDPFDENDFESHALACQKMPRTNIVGDDLTVTNTDRLRIAVQRRAIHGVVFKPNQSGTVTAAMDALEFVTQQEMLVVPSGRGGGAMTDIMKEISIGSHVHFQKVGAPIGGPRTEALNDLIRAAAATGRSDLADVTRFLKFLSPAL